MLVVGKNPMIRRIERARSVLKGNQPNRTDPHSLNVIRRRIVYEVFVGELASVALLRILGETDMETNPQPNSPFWRTLGKTKEQTCASLEEIPKFVLEQSVGTVVDRIQEGF